MFVTFLLAAALAAEPAANPPSDDSAPIDVVGQRSKEKRIVCKSSVATGTLFARKNCKSQAEWERIEASSRAYMDRVMQEQSDEMGRRMQCMANGGSNC